VFIGEHRHSIDPKKRLALPSRFRSELKNKVVVTRGLDKCLFVYPLKVWEEIAGKLGTLPVGESATRSFIRLQLSGAIDCEIDKQGRILIPDFLKEYAELDKDIVVAGVYNRLEIWDEKKWNEYKSKAEKNSEEIAEQLGKLGVNLQFTIINLQFTINFQLFNFQ
jgi:MraZ protein